VKGIDHRNKRPGRRWLFAAALLSCQWLLAGENPANCQSVNIPRLNAAEAIERLARQTGAKILFPYDIARNRPAQPVKGCMSIGIAINIMLEGSGLICLQSENGSFAIVENERNNAQTQAKK
jgi:hypothetical protein